MLAHITFKSLLLTLGLLMIPVFAYLWWPGAPTLDTVTNKYVGVGGGVKQDFQSVPTLPLTEEKDTFTLTDNTSDGIDIQFANQSDAPALGTETPKLNLSFPKDYSKPIEVKLDDKRTVSITDLSGKSDYQVDTLAQDDSSLGGKASQLVGGEPSLWNRLRSSLDSSLTANNQKLKAAQYLRYQSDDGRESLLYAYQKDQASGEKKLKHWTLYENGDGIEQESYKIDNAKVKLNSEGVAEVFYYTEQELKNDQAAAEVDSNLLARAQRTLAREMGDDLLSGNKTPDFTIPKPYYIDAQGEKHEAEWKWSEATNTLSVSFSPTSYPVALDPTLSFTAPGVSNAGSVITGEPSGAQGSALGIAMASGDFNADGKMDLAVGANTYGLTYEGRVYLFYNDGSYAPMANAADVVIHDSTGYTRFGTAVAAGDVNGDGKTDLIASTDLYDTSTTGAVKIFYNDGSYPTSASGADVTITGEASTNFGGALRTGDFNFDGKVDLVVGAQRYSSVTGRAYIFYNDGSIPTTAGSADVFINGNATGDAFGSSFATGDVNSDGRVDVIVGAVNYSSATGRAYIFYNDGSIPTAAGSADVTITGENASDGFSGAMTTGDFDADGKTDLAASSTVYSSYAGRVYVFYGDGSIPTTAATADVKITSSTALDELGRSLTSGDMNADGRTDLIVGAGSFFNTTGRAYVFYNDGSIPTTTASADVTITGEGGGYFGTSLATGDFNTDGKADLAVGAIYAAGNAGRAYFFYSQNGQVNTNQSITGNATNTQFGKALVTGDFNADGRIDLAVGTERYSSFTGRAYIFYGDGQIATAADSADVIITGETASDSFGIDLGAGDFNADGKTDLVVSAYGYSSFTGRAYIFHNDGSIPTTAATADVIITGEASSSFGFTLASGDVNADSRIDLMVGATDYSSSTGRAYIFHNDGSIPTAAGSADVIITGEASSIFGAKIISGDFNADSKTDLAVGAYGYSTDTGRVYIFHNDGSIPTAASSADVIITGGASNNLFGAALTSGDFNTDGRVDLGVGAYNYSSGTGRVYIFHNDGSVPTTAATADVTVTGETTSASFGYVVASGDFNADGRTDLVVGSHGYSSNTGRVYILHNDGSIPTTAASADIVLNGEATSDRFGYSVTVGDMNGDGRGDLMVGAYGVTSNTGKVYFYETRENFAWQIQKQFTASTSPRTGLGGTGQEIEIVGESTSGFGYTVASGDWNADGKTDLAVGAYLYATSTGRAYIFYNDGTISNGATSADVVITGETTSSQFGTAIISGDWNADGKTDLAVGAYAYSTNTGRAYVFYNDGSYPSIASSADAIIAGETTSNKFGLSLTAGDFNADGKTDLVVSSSYYSSQAGRVYIFYSGSITTENASGADIIITGEAANDNFGISLAAADMNSDGKADLVAGSYGYSSFSGRVYLFYNGSIITENASGADVFLTGDATSGFGSSLVAGDFNVDGRTDIAVNAVLYSSFDFTGRVYIFYNDGTLPTTAATADVTITGGASSDQFGAALAAGDFNSDGRVDLAVGALGSSSNIGRAYMYYNDGSYPTTAATADIVLIGESAGGFFGYSLTSGDFNADGKTDLAVGGYNANRVYLYTFNDPVITGGATNNLFGYALATGDYNSDGRIDLAVSAYTYSSNVGRAYIFYNDGQIPNVVASADVTITGAASSYFGQSLASGDFNSDGAVDLAVGGYGCSSFAGCVYIFYNDGSIPTTSGTADVTITGEAGSFLGQAVVAGDFNADGRTDLASSAEGYSSTTGRAYMFYNDGSIPTTAATADAIITGQAGSDNFGKTLGAGDLNADGKVDFIATSANYSAGAATGRTYIFYDGSITTENASGADVIITGEASSSFGFAFTVGDFNADGKTDLAVGAFNYSTASGRTYIFHNDGSIPTTAATADVTITGEASSSFGSALVAGDWNADGRTDLAVGATAYSTSTGRVYVFNNDGSIPTTAATADVIQVGETTNNYFGYALATGDIDSDGKSDLIVGAKGYSTNTGRVYVLSSEVAATSTPPGTFYLKGTGTLKGTGKIK